MSDHDHMPTIQRDGASWLSQGKVTVVVDGHKFVRSWDEAQRLAMAIFDVLQLEARP